MAKSVPNKTKKDRPDWASDAAEVRRRFEAKMTDPESTVTRRIRDFLVPRFDEAIRENAATTQDAALAVGLALNHCSEILLGARSEVMADYEKDLDQGLSVEEKTKKRMQAAKSNAGKIFERFTAYAISRSLAGTGWALWKDTECLRDVLGVEKQELLRIDRAAFGSTVTVLAEADYVIFRPAAPLEHLVLATCKSSMKDRLHSATMWALIHKTLRSDAAMKALSLSAPHLDTLRATRYVLVTGDIAEEQPDLRGDKDARSLLQFDSSFFDAAFAAVTPKWNTVLGDAVNAGVAGTAAFYRLSGLPGYLRSIAP